jgi:hypothetical protein
MFSHWRDRLFLSQGQPETVLVAEGRMKSEAGFSMIETLLGLFLCALLLSLSGYGYNRLIPKFQLEGAVQYVVSDFQLARMKAIGQNCYYRIQFFPKEEAYFLERESMNTHSRWPGSREGIPRNFTQRDNPYHSPGVDLESSSINPVFSPRGTAVGTTIILKNASGRKIITLSTQGRVKVQEG